jgi:hypothetical protein
MNNLESMVIVITLQNFQIITRLLGTFSFFFVVRFTPTLPNAIDI